MGRVKNGRIRLQTDRSPLFILGYMHATKSIFAFHFYCLLFIYPSLFFFFFLFSFSIVSPVIIRRNSMLATLLNWLKIMRLLIYCRTLIDWKPLSATIDESFMLLSLLSLSLSLSLSFFLAFVPFKSRKFIGYAFRRHFAILSTAVGIFMQRFLSFSILQQHARQQYQYAADFGCNGKCFEERMVAHTR